VRWPYWGNRDDVISTTLAGHGLAPRISNEDGKLCTEQWSFNPPTQRQQLLIAATEELFFTIPKIGRHWKRIHAWAEGMEKTYVVFPEDHEVAAFYPLALLATALLIKFPLPIMHRASNISTPYLKARAPATRERCITCSCKRCARRERESLDILREYEAIAPDNPARASHAYPYLYPAWQLGRGHSRNIKAADAALDSLRGITDSTLGRVSSCD